MARRRFPRPSMVMLPNGLTLGNLFFGIYAIVSASRGEHDQAGWCIVLGGFCDALDGRIARATNSGSAFGEELDSLVDAISFGLAPALMIYFAELNKTKWDWIFVFLFASCAVMRLARFNIEQAGAETKAKYFTGLPSPAAGGTLATYYWFSQTPLYQTLFAGWPWETILRWLMPTLSFLMISNVPYRAWPRFSLRTIDGALGLLLLVSSVVALFLMPREFFFPVGVSYVIIGIVMAVLRGVLDLPNPLDPDGLSVTADAPEDLRS
ncbi:MAG: CDP-diacylglycerol--serine O-phosphatidyltransferase [Gemmatimonadota bacterium]|jgi:CDP-diacylglycerol--serine O-phosphatidyltransferase|nr:CDP-diacylglycerol--serine O-phosphatidyltransferase [Gemmatimonadota bacterium]MDQ8146955.1 CDP-diacylglycerol--serine O-phosphatidyltransferase [Gemmatimonadota bacterium]MDQ8148840.1 CDP-diacylglycerol--serine O-phosphatidyltransferase [Gemmatimonadota bacterium]MDQ8156772.1 CDP-diacylglycerol--serine O-phosphatidyltransferase [Gemmatimonadota bacterium]MDQ8176588.1 CDP-diacylglycerol--serine O-phosphatidyltransferase [Gemmatimonadota bacterium]